VTPPARYFVGYDPGRPGGDMAALVVYDCATGRVIYAELEPARLN
jgi:hypothetical protein